MTSEMPPEHVAQPAERPLAGALMDDLRQLRQVFAHSEEVVLQINQEVDARTVVLRKAAGRAALLDPAEEPFQTSIDEVAIALQDLGISQPLAERLKGELETEPVPFHEQVQKRLASSPMTQREMAQKLGITEAYLSRLLSGQRGKSGTSPYLRRAAEILNDGSQTS
jgi:hypothetical protein